MKRILGVLTLTFGLFFWGNNQSAEAQVFGVKTNLLYDATATLNLGVEFGLAKKWSFDLSGNYNAWDNPYGKGFYKHMFAQPELRFWFCDRFNGHFLGLHALGGVYNVGGLDTDMKIFGYDLSKFNTFRYEGWFVGAGIGYGYSVILSSHWNMEFEIGAGFIYSEFDKYECEECGLQLEHQVPLKYFGPTKASVGLIYLF